MVRAHLMKAANQFFFFLILVLGVLASEGATVTWDGGGGNNAWENAANWSANVAPGAADDVVISGTGEVVYSTGSTTVRSLQSARGVTISGGRLTLAGGTSSVQGAFSMTGGALTDRKSGV